MSLSKSLDVQVLGLLLPIKDLKAKVSLILER
jgi:hypothetical protein